MDNISDEKLDIEPWMWLIILLMGVGIITTDNPEIKKEIDTFRERVKNNGI